MDRRTLLRGVVALATGTGAVGCTGNNEVPETAPPAPAGVSSPAGDGAGPGDDSNSQDPGAGPKSGGETADPSVSFETFDARSGPDGRLVVTVTVRNDGGRPQVRLVEATVTIGSDTYVVTEFVSVDPGRTKTVEMPVDVGYETFVGEGGIEFDLVARTPATVTPTDEQAFESTGTGTGGSSPTPSESTTAAADVDTLSESVDASPSTTTDDGE